MMSAVRPSARSFFAVKRSSPLFHCSITRSAADPTLLRAASGALLVAAALAIAHVGWGATPGTIPGAFAVGDQGTASYTIPIEAPAAAGGLKPSLALVYNHWMGDGLAGMHWTLAGLSMITRCGSTYAQDGSVGGVTYSSADKFCLDGQRLVVKTSTEFRSEIETFQRITKYGTQGAGPQYFTVEHGNGLVSYYGQTADSRLESAGSGSTVKTW